MFSLTSISLRKTKPKCEDKSKKSSITSSHSKSLSMITTKNQNNKIKVKSQSYFLSKNRDSYEKTKKDFLNYLIDDQLQYADLNSIENELIDESFKRKKQIDLYYTIIENKKSELTSLNSQIEKLLVNECELDSNKIENEYYNEINELKKKISSLEYDLEIYNDTKKELLNEKIKLEVKVKENANLYENDKKQYDSYLMIRENMRNEMKKQNMILNKMKIFDINCENIYDEELRRKKQKYAKEEYALTEVKKNVEEIENRILYMKNKNKKNVKQITKINDKNYKIFDEYKNIKKEYYANKMKLLLIYNQVHSKKIANILSLFTSQNIKFNTNNLIFANFLKDISDLKCENSAEEKIKSEVIHKIKKFTKDKLKYKILCENYLFSNKEVEELYKKIKLLKTQNFEKQKKLYSLTITMRKVFDMLYEYDRKFNAIINSLLYSKLFDDPNGNQQQYVNILKYLKFSNRDFDFEKLKRDINKKAFFINSNCKSLIIAFLKFARKLLYLQSYILITLYQEQYGYQSSSTFQLFPLQTIFTSEEAMSNAKSIRKQIYEQKIAIKTITNNSLFTQKQTDKQNKTNHNRATMRNLMNNYVHTTNDNTIWKQLGTKFYMQFSKYTNDYVLADKHSKLAQIDKQKKYTNIITTTTESSNRINTELKHDDNDDSDDNSISIAEKYNNPNEIDDTNENQSKRRNNTTEARNRFQRMNDLYQLKFSFITNKKKDVLFNEIVNDYNRKKNSKIYKEIVKKQREKKQIKIKHRNRDKLHKKYQSLKTLPQFGILRTEETDNKLNLRKTQTMFQNQRRSEYVVTFPHLRKQLSLEMSEEI